MAVSYASEDRTAVITVDDGKANALSFDVLAAINESLDRAGADRAAAIVLAGRPGMLSGGFDLGVMRSGDPAAIGNLVTAGGELVLRLYRSSTPVVIACTGHAVAAGALLLLGSHARVGADGEFRIVLIETTIGLVLPDWAVEIARERLSKRHVQTATIESRVYDPMAAADAGFLDSVVPADRLMEAAMQEAARLAALPPDAYAGAARKVRGPGIDRVAAAIARDRADVRALGGAVSGG